jgi:hypothetical protein
MTQKDRSTEGRKERKEGRPKWTPKEERERKERKAERRESVAEMAEERATLRVTATYRWLILFIAYLSSCLLRC